MTNEHTDLPWSTDEHEHDTPYEEIEIRGADGRRICRIWMDDAPLPDYNREQRANARHIVHCVNNHERLVEALGQAGRVMTDGNEMKRRLAAKGVESLLAALEAEKGGEL